MTKPKLLDEACNVARLKHLRLSTEKAYVSFIRRYILFHNKRHPVEMGVAEIREFLTHLAVEQHVAASTQNTAFSAFYGSGLRLMEALRLRVMDIDKDVRATMVYTHVLNRGGRGVHSPLDLAEPVT